MRLDPRIFLLFGLISILGLSAKNAHASHAMGGDIYYECINAATNSYRVTFDFYRDCAGISAPSSVSIQYTSSCGSGSVTASRIGPGTEVSPLCPAQINQSRCRGGSLPGVERYTYQAVINNLAPCANWVFGTGINARNGAITTGPSGTLWVQSELNNVAAPCNSSPQFTTIPVPYVCVNNLVNYNQGATDPDGDSLVFTLVQPRTSATSFVNFNPGLSPTQPISTSGSFNFNQTNGNLSFTANAIQVGVLAVEVSEYRNGIRIGSTVRDIQITVLSCANQAANTNGLFNISGGDTLDPFTARVCPNTTLSFDIQATDPDNHTVTMTTNVASQIPGANFTQSPPGTSVSANFSWFPTNNDRGTHRFFLNLVDDGCPVAATASYGITIIVDSLMEAGPDTFILCEDPIRLRAFGGDTFTWSPSIGLSNPNIQNPVASNTVPTMYTVNSNCGADSVFVDVLGPQYTVDAGQGDTTCTGGNASLNASINPSAGAYSYNWAFDTTLSDTTIFSPVATPRPGQNWYYFTVTEGPCTVTDSALVISVQPSFVDSRSIDSVDCNGGNDGQINLSVTGGQAPYNYSINGQPFVNNGLFTGLGAGSYTVRVQDGLGCDTSYNVEVDEPTPISINLQDVDSVTCPRGTDGQITVAGSGGTGSYSFYQSGGVPQASPVFSGLSSDAYTIVVSDANNCRDSLTTDVHQPAFWGTDSLIMDSADCNGDPTGIITFSGNGGSGNYSYSLGGGPLQANGYFDSLTAGTYSIRMEDAAGCDTTYSIRVLEPQIVDLTIVNIDSTNCPFGDDGAVQLGSTGGTLPYQYALVGNPWQRNSSFGSLSAGNYQFVVEDRYGCSDSISADVQQPAALEVAQNTVDSALCFGDSTGQITLSAQGGHAPYSYAIGSSPLQSLNSFSNLPTGNYSIRIRDNRGCDTSYSFFVPQPTQVDAFMALMDSVDCNGNSTGSLVTGVNGGTPSYLYSIDNGPWGASPTFRNLLAGQYMLKVRDANGCEDSAQAVVLQPSTLNAGLLQVDSVTCHGDMDGSFTVRGVGATPPYQFSIDGSNFQNSGTFDSLGAQNYTVTVRDANGCEHDISFPIYQNPPYSFNVDINDVLCHGEYTGAINVSASGNQPPYQYSIDGVNFSGNGLFNSLPANNYTIFIRDANNCEARLFSNITQPNPIQASLASLDSVYFLYGNDGSFSLNTSGGSAPLRYSLDGGQTFQSSAVFDSLEAGTYQVLIQDTNLCDTVVTIIVPNHIPSPDFGIPNAFTPNGDGENDFFEVVDRRNEYEIMTFQVFNRWGQLIFDGPALGLEKWDGTYKGEVQPMGNYTFLIHMRRIDGVEFEPISGNVLLIW